MARMTGGEALAAFVPARDARCFGSGVGGDGIEVQAAIGDVANRLHRFAEARGCRGVAAGAARPSPVDQLHAPEKRSSPDQYRQL